MRAKAPTIARVVDGWQMSTDTMGVYGNPYMNRAIVAWSANRFAIGDRDALKFNADGSLALYIQHENPGSDKQSNWLPSPKSGVLGMTMRLYAPKAEVLNGSWTPPPMRRQP